MHQYGNLILGASRKLLKRTHAELMEPLGYLQSIMDSGSNDKRPIDWAELKRNQRVRALREYWELRRKREQKMRELAKLYPRGKSSGGMISQNADVLSKFVAPFSDEGYGQLEVMKNLKKVLKAGLSKILPWRQIFFQQIKSGKRTLSELSPIIHNKKKDATMKLKFLLELAHDQHIALHQQEAFGAIQLTPKNLEIESMLTIGNRKGIKCWIDWFALSDHQRQKVISDLKDGHIVLI